MQLIIKMPFITVYVDFFAKTNRVAHLVYTRSGSFYKNHVNNESKIQYGFIMFIYYKRAYAARVIP